MWALAASLAEGPEDLRIDLPRIGLPGHGVGGGKADFLGDEPLQFDDLLVVAVEQPQEAGLRAGRPLGTAGPQPFEPMLDFGQVERQVVGPEARPLADRRRLRRLQVGEAQSRRGPLGFGETGQPVDDQDNLIADQCEGLAEQDRSVLSVIKRSSPRGG